MTKKELISEVQSNLGGGVTKQRVGDLLEGLFGTIGQAVKAHSRYSHPGFGIFTIKERAARTGRNPQTGKPVQIPAGKTVGFKPSTELKTSLNS